jgi:hypothetical protein
MSKGFKYANFESVDNMNPTVRSQQYAFNGRIFIPPNTVAPQTDSFVNGSSSGSNNNINYQYSKYAGGLLPQLGENESSKPYDLYKNSSNYQDTSVDIISNIVVPNGLSRTFFSNDNVERLQRQIVNEVYKQSQKQIGKQSYSELQIIMKSIYLQYGKNLNTDIEGQVITLNKYVIDECARIIVPNILQYNKYIEDITSPIPVMPRSQNVSNKGYKFGDFSTLIPSTQNTLN